MRALNLCVHVYGHDESDVESLLALWWRWFRERRSGAISPYEARQPLAKDSTVISCVTQTLALNPRSYRHNPFEALAVFSLHNIQCDIDTDDLTSQRIGGIRELRGLTISQDRAVRESERSKGGSVGERSLKFLLIIIDNR